MSQTISGYHNTVQTLSSGAPSVTITGTINAYGAAAVYSIRNNGTLTPTTISAAVFGPAGTDFSINNTGLIETHGTNTSNPFDVGILLGSPGSVVNSGTVEGASGIAVFNNSSSSTAYVDNSNLIDGSIGVGVYIMSAGSLVNSGRIFGAQSGVNLSRTATSYLSNSSTGTITAGANYAVQLQNGIVKNAGLLDGASGGVQLYAQGSILNSGTIEASGTVLGTNNSYAGIEIQQGGNVYNSLSGTITGLTGIQLQGSTASYIDNAGKITGTQTEGIVSDTAFTIKNTGTISGVNHGITSHNPGGPSTINNYGLIIATGTTFIAGATTYDASGIVLSAGGTITNHTSGQITGNLGIYLSGGGGNTPIYLDNLGSIAGTASNGVILKTSGKLFNAGNITGAADGVDILSGGKLVNAGTITGHDGIAVKFAGSASATSQVGLDPGAAFNGMVEVAGGNGILKLSSASTVGTISGIGTQFTGFDTIDIQVGASWLIEGSSAGLASGQAFAGFGKTDTIILDGFTATSESYVTGMGLELSNGNSTEILDIAGTFNSGNFSISSNPSGTVIEDVACFASGTRIATPRGDVVVEELAIGDEVIVHGGGTAPIKWIGYRRINLDQHSTPILVSPVVISAGAICDGVPHSDLFVSPDHGLYLDGCLIAAKDLLNGHSVRKVSWSFVEYFHIELAKHGVVYANGTPVETYLDTGNRSGFENNTLSNIVDLHPDFGFGRRERLSCAPFLTYGPRVEAVRARILRRADIPVTDDPDVQIFAGKDGSTIIVSRAGQPGYLTADPRDKRLLGVKIGAITIGGRPITMDDAALVDGWHDPEPDGRWTNGAAIIPGSLKTSPDDLVEITIMAQSVYEVAREDAVAVNA